MTVGMRGVGMRQGPEGSRETHGTRALLSATKQAVEQGGLRAHEYVSEKASGCHVDSGVEGWRLPRTGWSSKCGRVGNGRGAGGAGSEHRATIGWKLDGGSILRLGR